MLDARLVKRYAQHGHVNAFALDVHLQAARGITVLFGASGAGKSLVLNCLAGFIKPDEGRILLNDRIYFDAAANVSIPAEHRRCGYIFQDSVLFPHMTILSNLHFAENGHDRHVSRLERRRQVQELLERFELTDVVHRKPNQLSGGQQQRVALVRALISQPRLLLFDEPAAGLDLRLRMALYEMVREFQERLQIPFIWVTHDLDEAAAIGDSIHLLQDGRSIQNGNLKEVCSRPSNLAAARLLGIFNLTPAEIVALDPGRDISRIRILGSEVEANYLPGHLIGDQGWLCVPKSQVRVAQAGVISMRNEIQVGVQSRTPTLEGTRLTLGDVFTVDVRHNDTNLVGDDRRVSIELPKDAISFLTK